ncbi:hypothetical protein FUA23_13715 [Neolewinella aurantiaca]|uniref:Uncharacterized protein n=1 Tax=Neolewinella aurantiaca TaxID=2602767 RepID=A0A5C7FDF2_9BACT|nr:hypothetical protein FUA23_13715 [Neolewinella aurantiaca]
MGGADSARCSYCQCFR